MKPAFRLTTTLLGLLLALPAAGLLSAEPEPGDAGATEAGAPRPKLDPPSRAEVDKLIGQLGTRVASFHPARTKLREYLDGLDAEGRARVLEAIKEALPKINKVQRFHLVRMLGDWGQPEGLALIAPYITDKDDSVQRAALSGVSRAKNPDPALLPSIRPLIESTDDNVRKEAILSIGRMKDYASVPALIEMLRTGDEGLRTNVLWALREITGKDFGFDVNAWLDWWRFYQSEVVAKRKPDGANTPDGGQTGLAQGTAGAASSAGQPASSTQAATEGRMQLWGMGALGALALLLLVGWGFCRWWLRATMNRLLAVDPTTARDPAAVALRFAASDHMPDWIVYPFLARCIESGALLEINAALNVLMFRLHGGCAATAVNGGRLPQETPVQGARERIVRFPRGLLADLALAGYQPGRVLIRIAEPDSPVWRREPTAKEKLTAERHISSLLKKR